MMHWGKALLGIVIGLIFVSVMHLASTAAYATKADRPGWAVWAYRMNPNAPEKVPRGWHPCYIQYVASEYPNPRYTTERGYVRVRFARSQKEADQFISIFSMYHDDRTDNVVKLYTCRSVKFAASYAHTAVNQNKQNISRRCGFQGHAWQNNFDNHFQWALGKSPKRADEETKWRDKALRTMCKSR